MDWHRFVWCAAIRVRKIYYSPCCCQIHWVGGLSDGQLAKSGHIVCADWLTHGSDLATERYWHCFGVYLFCPGFLPRRNVSLFTGCWHKRSNPFCFDFIDSRSGLFVCGYWSYSRFAHPLREEKEIWQNSFTHSRGANDQRRNCQCRLCSERCFKTASAEPHQSVD